MQNHQTSLAPLFRKPANVADRIGLASDLLVFILSLASVTAVVLALNLQDVRRDEYELWSPSGVYFTLLVLLGLQIVATLLCLIRKRYALAVIPAAVLLTVTVVVWLEGSVTSYGFYPLFLSQNFTLYEYTDDVEMCNTLWLLSNIFLFAASLLPAAWAVIRRSVGRYHKSIRYRERCYQRADKLYGYVEKGILSQQEYEQMKREILKHIQ